MAFDVSPFAMFVYMFKVDKTTDLFETLKYERCRDFHDECCILNSGGRWRVQHLDLVMLLKMAGRGLETVKLATPGSLQIHNNGKQCREPEGSLEGE